MIVESQQRSEEARVTASRRCRSTEYISRGENHSEYERDGVISRCHVKGGSCGRKEKAAEGV